MIRIDAPASSANLGPGFDCLGLSLDIYNTFEAELFESDVLENTEERYNNRDNLFLQAYRRGCEAIGVSDHVKVRFDCHIPSTRGMGSSAAFINAGITAASVLHGCALSKDEIFTAATEMEGHPDNIAPALYGGLTASAKTMNGIYVKRDIPLDPSWLYTLFIPDYEVDTKRARAALPDFYPRKNTSITAANAILTLEALRTGDLELLKGISRDVIHEPYRAALIRGFETIRETAEKDSGGRLVISGSGPACLLISKKELSAKAEEFITSVYPGIQVVRTGIAGQGLLVDGKPL